jgi:hypothetical protein
VVHQHLAHHARHEREKVRAIGGLWPGVVEQLDERFVDERSRLERVSRVLTPHERLRNPPQLAMDERHELVERGSVPRTHPLEQSCDVGHRSIVTDRGAVVFSVF